MTGKCRVEYVTWSGALCIALSPKRIMEMIGRKIKDLRVLKGLTQEDLAERTQLSVRTIQRIEKGEVDPRTYTLNLLAEALKVMTDKPYKYYGNIRFIK